MYKVKCIMCIRLGRWCVVVTHLLQLVSIMMEVWVGSAAGCCCSCKTDIMQA